MFCVCRGKSLFLGVVFRRCLSGRGCRAVCGSVLVANQGCVQRSPGESNVVLSWPIPLCRAPHLRATYFHLKGVGAPRQPCEGTSAWEFAFVTAIGKPWVGNVKKGCRTVVQTQTRLYNASSNTPCELWRQQLCRVYSCTFFGAN